MDIDKLKALALAATPGPWIHDAEDNIIYPSSGARMIDISCRSTDLGAEQRDCNASFIAAANPAAILELIAEVERLRAAISAKEPDTRIDERYEFERHMSQRGDATEYIGDGMYSNGSVQDQWEAWLGRAAIESHSKAEKERT